MTAMSLQIVGRLLKRFKRDEFDFVLDNWSVLRNIDTADTIQLLQRPSGKSKFITAILRLLKNEHINTVQVSELDLLHVELQPRSRKWSVFRLEDKPECGMPIGFSPKLLQKNLRAELNKFRFQNMVVVGMHDEAYWIRLELIGSRETKKAGFNNATYVVLYPRIPFLCIANIKPKYSAYINQAFIKVLRSASVVDMKLTGRCVKSLLDIVLQQNSQGLTGSTTLAPPSLLSLPQSRKRKYETEDYEIEFENVREKRRRSDYINTKFGDGSLPTLECLTYKMETGFRGHGAAPNMPPDALFRCSVKFEGSNVLEGLRNLATAGLADIPMKNHLVNVPSLASNTISLVRKRPGVA